MAAPPLLRPVAILALAAGASVALGARGAGGGDPPSPDFARDIRPILAANCFACHGADAEARQAKLRLDTREGATRDLGGGFAAIVPGDAGASELLFRITDPDDPMPPPETGRHLNEEQVGLLERWIEDGAHYSAHWAFTPPERPALPEVAHVGWPRRPLDRFVLARMEAEGLEPSPEADRWTLARRVSLDLTGLPPSFERVRAFADDPRPDAYERFVDELLASPAYGEHQAAKWLDLARYADSSGHGSDPLRTIWRYRDWVIDAFNENLPYDVFTRQQLAGDLLPDATMEQKLATAFHRNTMTNTEGGTDDEEWRVAAVKDRAVTTAQVWMGLTMGCAECHSHKFDPISHEDYYRYFAFFNQTADNDRNDDAPRLETPTDEQARLLEELRTEVAALEDRIADPDREIEAEIAAWVAEQRAAAASWTVLEPTALRSRSGARFEVLDDGSVLARGDSGATDVYEIELRAPAGATALRVEALSHSGLPNQGPGRSPGNGNFVLSELELIARAGAAEAEKPPRGRFLRITNHDPSRILSLAEVEVFSEGENHAPAGTASQSSTAFGGPPARAVDGNTSGVFAEGSVTHTAIEDDPWWELDLGAVHEVERVVVWNRTDGGLEKRLADFEIRLLDETRATVWSRRVEAAPTPSAVFPVGTGGAWIDPIDASASFEQEGYEARRALAADGRQKEGWAIAPRQGASHRAVFRFAEPVAGRHWTLRLHQDHGAWHTLGRFRLAASTDAPPPRALPDPVAEAIALDPAGRSAEQTAALVRHFEAVDPQLAAWRARVDAIEERIEELDVVTTPVMVELPPAEQRTTHVLDKGNFLAPLEEVEAGTPDALHAWPEGAPRNRLGLADWLVSPDNPLAARVAVNRHWARLFGRGLVETEEDFGTQGALPSHPALLDWLAVGFRDGGWDTKALLRRLVTSATYRQASRLLASHRAKDPGNRWLARAPRVPLSAEMVRDTLLAAGGLLSRKTHGPSVFPPQPPGLWKAAFNNQRDWPTSSGEDRYRRGLYVFLRRTVPYPAMATFDAPSRETCTIRRERTNTPLQAFVTLNDPVFVEAAQALARRMVAEGPDDARGRVAWGLARTRLRPAEPTHIAPLLELFEAERTHYAARPGEARKLATDPFGPLPEGADPAEMAAWTVVANVLLNQDAVLVKS